MTEINIYDEISMINDKMIDILESLTGETPALKLDYVHYEPKDMNHYGICIFEAKICDIPFKRKEFNYQPAFMTAKSFVNEVKAYMLDVLDGVANLM